MKMDQAKKHPTAAVTWRGCILDVAVDQTMSNSCSFVKSKKRKRLFVACLLACIVVTCY